MNRVRLAGATICNMLLRYRAHKEAPAKVLECPKSMYASELKAMLLAIQFAQCSNAALGAAMSIFVLSHQDSKVASLPM